MVTPLAVLTGYLTRQHPGAAVLTVAEPLVDQTLTAAGITVTAELAAAGVVVVSFDRTFSYPKLLLAYRAVRHFGAVIVATNPDRLPDPGRRPAGLRGHARGGRGLHRCARRGNDGQAGRADGRRAAAAAGHVAGQHGDRRRPAVTDVTMSGTLGMTSVLVLSGATAVERPGRLQVRPDYVIEGIGQLLPDWTPWEPR